MAARHLESATREIPAHGISDVLIHECTSHRDHCIAQSILPDRWNIASLILLLFSVVTVFAAVSATSLAISCIRGPPRAGGRVTLTLLCIARR
ncbi:hypothetical protein ACL02S_15475 [Nocardia sp. 004]|uniref:hypothetical protein n=1 Tax=Nocardia sp. 004 TaxID=3385978 RepID=UPI0039A36D99